MIVLPILMTAKPRQRVVEVVNRPVLLDVPMSPSTQHRNVIFADDFSRFACLHLVLFVFYHQQMVCVQLLSVSTLWDQRHESLILGLVGEKVLEEFMNLPTLSAETSVPVQSPSDVSHRRVRGVHLPPSRRFPSCL